MAEPIHIDDTGTGLIFTVSANEEVMDLSAATTKEIIFDKPKTNNVITKPAVFVTDGTDGKVKYVSESDFFDIRGKWKAQGHFVFPTGEWHTSIVEFEVAHNLSE